MERARVLRRQRRLQPRIQLIMVYCKVEASINKILYFQRLASRVPSLLCKVTLDYPQISMTFNTVSFRRLWNDISKNIHTFTSEDQQSTKNHRILMTSELNLKATGLRKKTKSWQRPFILMAVRIGRKLLRIYEVELTCSAFIDGKKCLIQIY